MPTAKTRYTIQLCAKAEQIIEEEAEQAGISRSLLIAQLIQAGIKAKFGRVTPDPTGNHPKQPAEAFKQPQKRGPKPKEAKPTKHIAQEKPTDEQSRKQEPAFI